jgi:branched-chain amino acid transport system permease protein
MDIVIQGLLLGGLYCAASLGLSLVFGVLGLVNLAHGQLLVLGALLTSVVVGRMSGDPLVWGAVVALVVAAFAYPVQRILLTPVLRRGPEATVPVTFGIGIMLSSILLLTLGSDPRVISSSYATSSIEVLGSTVRISLLVALAFAIVMTVGLHLLLTRTRFGGEVSAAAADPQAAEVVGIDVASRYAATFAIAAFTASLGGTLVGISFAVEPVSGLGWLVRAFTVVVLGGLGSIPGTFVGAMVVGLAEVAGAQFLGAEYRDVVVFGLLVVVLLIRPQGLASSWTDTLPRLRARLSPQGAEQ